MVVLEKPICSGELPEKGGAWIVCKFKGEFGKKEGGWGGGGG